MNLILNFHGCLGALDGTYIVVTPSSFDKPIYQTRKGRLATNALGVCTRDMKFVYVIAGWEGSISDSRIMWCDNHTKLISCSHWYEKLKFLFVLVALWTLSVNI